MAHPSTYFLQTHFFQFLQALFYPLSFFSLVSLIFPGTFSCQPPNIFKSSPPKTIFPPNLKALLATTAFSSSLYRKALHLSPSVFHSHFSSDHCNLLSFSYTLPNALFKVNCDFLFFASSGFFSCYLEHPVLLTTFSVTGLTQFHKSFLLLFSLYPYLWIYFLGYFINIGVPQDSSLAPSILILTFSLSLSLLSHWAISSTPMAPIISCIWMTSPSISKKNARVGNPEASSRVSL